MTASRHCEQIPTLATFYSACKIFFEHDINTDILSKYRKKLKGSHLSNQLHSQVAMIKQDDTTLFNFSLSCKLLNFRISAALSTVCTIVLFSAFHSVSYAEESCPDLLTNRCEQCHYNTRVCQKVQKKKGKSSWKRTVKNMVRQGAKLNKSEQKKLVACLSKRTPEILEFCNLKK